MSDKVAAPLSTTSRKEIKEFSVNDVLLGRGPGLCRFEGNLRFRSLVDDRKDEYVATNKRKQKRRIAKEILELVHSKGGRFLKQDNDAVDGAWHEVDEAAAMEKTKQSLRELRLPSEISSIAKPERTLASPLSANDDKNCASPFESEAPVATGVSPSRHGRIRKRDSTESNEALGSLHHLETSQPSMLEPNVAPLRVPPAMPAKNETTPSPLVDPRLLLFRQVPFQQQPSVAPTQSLLMLQFLHSQLGNAFQSATPSAPAPSPIGMGQEMLLQYMLASGATSMTSSRQQHDMIGSNVVQLQPRCDDVRSNVNVGSLQRMDEGMTAQEECLSQDAVDETTSEEDEVNASSSTHLRKQSSSCQSIDDELAAFLLSSLAVTDRQIISNEEEEMERQQMSEKERAAALSDLFGRMRENESPHHKRARRDLDRISIHFLVCQMRRELDKIPMGKKLAMIEAQAKARPEEFYDARLEQFLRCEGMNSQMAAQRFVRYWESRRQVFGPEKYSMRMTISEALRDDLTALKAGVYNLLPFTDVSGRQITYLETRLHNMNGYDSDSMLRAFWYIVEVTAQGNKDVSSGIVQLVWFKDATVFDYDRKVYDRVADLYTNAFPIKMLASHLCCPPMVITRVVQPIIHAFMDQRFRARTIAHDVDESEIVSVLSSYGIQKEMIPTAMGGDVHLNPSEWLAYRRAVEMEEL